MTQRIQTSLVGINSDYSSLNEVAYLFLCQLALVCSRLSASGDFSIILD
ncbi:unnamed protein product [Brugia timori]|uniref:Uncharacterized protein n=1 Tax=Brugia timori TaxID=42155 RepID=A0A0R3RD07_9BILA|nr:unnamed protein product [Brugia timori]